jgi:signal transduction histidine kinase/ligand-binding sensor domain-containing protein/CheY-like chemotaxis protein/AraC-like DNA-binding protein
MALFCELAYSQRSSIHFEHLSVKDGLSQISVVAIFQDKEGFLWFGTRDGLNKYDGYNFHVFCESDTAHYISNNYITCMAEDKNGQMWVGTKNGLNRYDKRNNRFIPYYNNDDSTSLCNSNITQMKRDSRGNLWVGTISGLDIYQSETDDFKHFTMEGFPSEPVYGIAEDHDENIWIGLRDGLYVYHTQVEKLHAYKHHVGDEHSFAANRVSALFCDSKGRVWVGTHQQGVCLYDKQMDHFIRYTENDGLNNNNIRCFVEDKAGVLLVGTFNGLSKYDPLSGKFSNAFGNTVKNTIPINNFSVYSALCDRSGTVWVGTYSGGVSYYNAITQRFRLYDPGMQKQVIYGIVGPMAEYPDGLWIGTEGGGLLFFDRKKATYIYYDLPESSGKAYNRNIIKSLLLDGNILWVGTADNRIHQFDVHRRKFLKWIFPPWGVIHYALIKDSNQNLWIGSSGEKSIGYMSPDGHFTFPLTLNDGTTFNPVNIHGILADSTDGFFIATYDYGLYYYHHPTKTVDQWSHSNGDSSGIAYNKISSIIKTKNGRIWISMPGGGIAVLNSETGRFTNYGQAQGLASNTVYTILEDHDEKIWLSTSSGISMFDPLLKRFTNYGRNNGVMISEFTPNSGIVTSDNEVFFGGNDGFISFYPRDLQSNTYIPPVVITKISINNTPIAYFGNNEEEPLRLDYKQSNISIEFSALNYLYPFQNQYAYRLEGFDRDWIYIGNRRVAYYTNIQPGKYTFRVKGANNDGVWNETSVDLPLVITPPFWNTWWAWLIYLFIATTIVSFLVRYARIKIRLENNIRIKQIEQKNLETLHQTKIELFTDFAHELRTPLTLILSPLEDILQKTVLPLELSATLNLMLKNANRLLHTVNNLLDFRKKESGHLHLKAAPGNIVKFTNEIVIAFNELARKRQIQFSFRCGMTDLQVWYDRDLLEKVLFNILSNAFKNTPDGGAIFVNLGQEKAEKLRQVFGSVMNGSLKDISDCIVFEISDTGKGIPETELERIFEPFYQIHTKNTPQLFGTGIGLNFSKSVIELHRGIVWAANNSDKGAVFRIVLPSGKVHLKENELELDYKNSEDVSYYTVLPEQEVEPDVSEDTDSTDFKYSILIIEDNIDVRYYIKSHVRKQYQVYEAGNGDEAFEMALTYLPDLIVSDIMMPGMDGIELCRLLKDDIRTGHIPVILLTARMTVLQIQEGFETGADEYITKPFNAGLLLTRIKNLINTREKLKTLFGRKSSELFPDLPTSQVDSRFMDSIYEYIREHLDETGLNMDPFCKKIGMSRSSFYRKLQTISDLTPVELIRNTRLQYALKYLRETDLNITEIAYKTGFSSQSYFTKTFKSFFNQSPSEMRKKYLEH